MKKLIIFIIFLFTVSTINAQTFEMVMNKAYTLLSIAQERDRQASERVDETKSRRIRCEEDLIDLQERKLSNALQKKEYEKLEKQLKTLRIQEKEFNKMRLEAAAFLSDVTDIIKDSDKNRAKFITNYEKVYGIIPELKLNETADNTAPNIIKNTPPTEDKIAQLERAASEVREQDGFVINNNPNIAPPKTQENQPEVRKGKKDKIVKNDPKKRDDINRNSKSSPQLSSASDASQFVVYDTKNDVNINPPAPECIINFDGIDNFTGKKKRETAIITLFRHTEEFMRSTLKSKDYITCEVSMSRVQGGFYFLNMNFTILTKEGQKAFGFLDRGTPISFKFINGSNLTLQNAKTDIGTFDAEKGTSVYKIQIQMDNSNAKTLASMELDAVRITWSAGYEDYEIYDMDALMNLFRCLDKS